tara:strand:- start:1538 stop:2035 length:498 start_codon:yes stop_codon:yes gene_type:complete
MFGLTDILDRDRFFNSYEENLIDRICLNAFKLLKFQIKNKSKHKQNGPYTNNQSAPFYRYSEVVTYYYSFKKDKQKRDIQFYKYFYKNEKQWEWFMGLADSFTNRLFRYHVVKDFPVVYWAINPNDTKINGVIIKIEYGENGIIEKKCETEIKRKTNTIIKNMFK